MTEHYLPNDELRNQLHWFINSELKQNQTGEQLRGRWHGRPTGISRPDFTTPCDCCDDLTTVQGYVVESTKNCCQYTPDTKLYLTESVGVYQSDAFACTDDYETEWTLDTEADPITATIRTTDGDVVYTRAKSTWRSMCLNIMTLDTKPSDCNAGGCIKVYPLACERLRTVCDDCELEHTLKVDWSPLASRVDVALGGPAQQWFDSSLGHPLPSGSPLSMPTESEINLSSAYTSPCRRTGSVIFDTSGTWQSLAIATHGYDTTTRKNYIRVQWQQNIFTAGRWQLYFYLQWLYDDGACVNAPGTLTYDGFYAPRAAMVITDVPETLEVS